MDKQTQKTMHGALFLPMNQIAVKLLLLIKAWFIGRKIAPENP